MVGFQLFHDEGPCHKETSPLINSKSVAGFYMIGISVNKEPDQRTDTTKYENLLSVFDPLTPGVN